MMTDAAIMSGFLLSTDMPQNTKAEIAEAKRQAEWPCTQRAEFIKSYNGKLVLVSGTGIEVWLGSTRSAEDAEKTYVTVFVLNATPDILEITSVEVSVIAAKRNKHALTSTLHTNRCWRYRGNTIQMGWIYEDPGQMVDITTIVVAPAK